MHIRRWALVALAALALFAWRVQSCDEPPQGASAVIEPEAERAKRCFTATSEHVAEQSPMWRVFQTAGRSGNGETWYAILRAELNSCANVLRPITPDELKGAPTTGEHYEVRYRARRSWIAFDAEAGGVLVCAGDASLLEHMRTTYQRACKDPDLLRQLIDAVPDAAWDD